MPLEHLINLHNIRVRFIAVELITGPIETEDNAAWAAIALPVNSIYFIHCIWNCGG